MLGVSPRYLQVLENDGYRPNKHFNLNCLTKITASGSPLRPEQYVYIKDYIMGNLPFYLNNASGYAIHQFK